MTVIYAVLFQRMYGCQKTGRNSIVGETFVNGVALKYWIISEGNKILKLNWNCFIDDKVWVLEHLLGMRAFLMR